MSGVVIADELYHNELASEGGNMSYWCFKRIALSTILMFALVACGPTADMPPAATGTLAPSPKLAFTQLAELMRRGEPDDPAVADFDLALAIGPRPAIYAARGQAYLAQGETERAIADFDAALSAYPDDAEAYRLRGKAFARLGQRAKAVADLEKALSLNLLPERQEGN